MLSLSQKVYVQLAPDESAIKDLLSLQSNIDPSARRVSQQELHLTVIHIGLLSRVYTSITDSFALSEKQFIENAETLVSKLEQLRASVQTTTYRFERPSIALFGPHESSLVLTYTPDDNACRLYKESYTILSNFLSNCGIDDVDVFMRNDKNLRHAISFNPHVTLAKGADPNSRDMFIKKSVCHQFSIMPIVYDA